MTTQQKRPRILPPDPTSSDEYEEDDNDDSDSDNHHQRPSFGMTKRGRFILPIDQSGFAGANQGGSFDRQIYVDCSSNFGRKCRNFEELGYCLVGDKCPYSHGPNTIVVEDPLNAMHPSYVVATPDFNNQDNVRNNPIFINQQQYYPPSSHAAFNPASIPHLAGETTAPAKKMRKKTCSLLVRKIPPGYNNIAKINDYFSRFGEIQHIQVSFRGKPDEALLKYTNVESATRAYRCTEPIFANRFVNLRWYDDELGGTFLAATEPTTKMKTTGAISATPQPLSVTTTTCLLDMFTPISSAIGTNQPQPITSHGSNGSFNRNIPANNNLHQHQQQQQQNPGAGITPTPANFSPTSSRFNQQHYQLSSSSAIAGGVNPNGQAMHSNLSRENANGMGGENDIASATFASSTTNGLSKTTASATNIHSDSSTTDAELLRALRRARELTALRPLSKRFGARGGQSLNLKAERKRLLGAKMNFYLKLSEQMRIALLNARSADGSNNNRQRWMKMVDELQAHKNELGASVRELFSLVYPSRRALDLNAIVRDRAAVITAIDTTKSSLLPTSTNIAISSTLPSDADNNTVIDRQC